MKKLILILALASAFVSCKESSKEQSTLSEYFAKQDAGIQTGNEKIIQIESLGKKIQYLDQAFW